MISRLFLLFLCSISCLASAGNLPIKIERAWLQAVPPVSDVTAAYMKITNLGQTPVQLTGASSSIATKVEPMITTRNEKNGQEIMGMEGVERLEIAPGATLELKPGGNHLMVMGLVSHPKEGDHVHLTVQFAPGNEQIDVELPVLQQEPK